MTPVVKFEEVFRSARGDHNAGDGWPRAFAVRLSSALWLFTYDHVLDSVAFHRLEVLYRGYSADARWLREIESEETKEGEGEAIPYSLHNHATNAPLNRASETTARSQEVMGKKALASRFSLKTRTIDNSMTIAFSDVVGNVCGSTHVPVAPLIYCMRQLASDYNNVIVVDLSTQRLRMPSKSAATTETCVFPIYRSNHWVMLWVEFTSLDNMWVCVYDPAESDEHIEYAWAEDKATIEPFLSAWRH